MGLKVSRSKVAQRSSSEALWKAKVQCLKRGQGLRVKLRQRAVKMLGRLSERSTITTRWPSHGPRSSVTQGVEESDSRCLENRGSDQLRGSISHRSIQEVTAKFRGKEGFALDNACGIRSRPQPWVSFKADPRPSAQSCCGREQEKKPCKNKFSQ